MTLAALVVAVSACNTPASQPDGGSADPAIAGITPAGTTTPPTAGSSTPATTATPWGTLAPLPGSTIDDLAPVGDPEFDLTVGFRDGTQIESHVVGLVDLPVDDFQPDPGDCVGLLVTITSRIGDPTVNPYTDLRPNTSLEVAGTEVDTTTFCDEAPAQRMGWTGAFDGAGSLDRSTVNLLYAFFIPEGSPPIDAIVFGKGSRSPQFYQPHHLDEIPQAPSPRPGAVTNDASVDAPISVVDDQGGNFEVTIQGIVRGLPLDELATAEVGECVAVVGTMIARESPTLVPAGNSIPDITVAVDGLVFDDENCDATSVRKAGYESPLYLTSTIGNSFSFFETFVVPEGAAIQSVFVQTISQSPAAKVEPKVLDSIPIAPPPGTNNPELDPVAVSTGNDRTIKIEQARAYGDEHDDMEASVLGLVDVTAAVSLSPHRCVAILVNVAPTSDPELFIQIGVVAAGAYLTLNADADEKLVCDRSAMDAAGYIEYGDLTPTQRAAGTWAYSVVSVPSLDSTAAIVLGDPELPGVGLIEPVVLPAAPPVPT